MSLQDFKNNIKKVTLNRNTKVSNSLGVYDAYKYYRKNKPSDKKYILSESQYFTIIRQVNKELGKLLLQGNDIKLPCRMGILELRKYIPTIKIINNKLKTNLPIDWNRTLELWYEDEEAKQNKTLIKMEEKEVFKIYYNRELANYNNKSFYEFKLNRDLKVRLKQKIKNNELDAYTFKT